MTARGPMQGAGISTDTQQRSLLKQPPLELGFSSWSQLVGSTHTAESMQRSSDLAFLAGSVALQQELQCRECVVGWCQRATE
eukprot:610629-Amphidinium_carterae.1